jgi:hypothetical protein
MTQRLTRGSRLLASVIALALAFASTATCLAAVMQMPEKSQHACCHGQDCGSGDSMAPLNDCCSVPNADVARLTTPGQAVAAQALAVTMPFVFEPLPVQDSPGAALEPGVPKPSSSPTYLLVSVFRL